MPALLAYIVAVAIFLGGGYGALNWLAGPPEPAGIAAKARHAPRPETYGAATARRDPQPESATDVSGNSETANSPAVSAAPAAADQDKRYDAMARAEPAAEKSARPIPALKPAAAKATVATAAPESATASASTTSEAKPEAAKPAVAKTAGADRPLRPKRPRVRQAEERRHPRYEVMTLRTIEYPDGRRETRLLPRREQDETMAFRWGD
jgi:hypothetical protein